MTPPGERRPLLIAIDGRSGAGKTTLAIELTALLGEHRKVSLFHLEDIYPGWNGLRAGIERYVTTVLAPLREGRDAQWTAWDWEARHDGESRTTPAAEVVILEGVGAAHGPARDLLDAVIWVEAPAELRKHRALTRDGDQYAPYWELWADQESALLAEDSPSEHADIEVRGVEEGHQQRQQLDLACDVAQALGSVRLLAAALAPEQQRWLETPVRAEELDFRGDPEALFQALFGDSEHSVWLDSSAADENRGRRSIMADAGGSAGRLAVHQLGVTTQTFRGITVRSPGTFFSWLDAHWPITRITGEAGFALGWLGYLGYEIAGGNHSAPDDDAAPDAALLFAGRAIVLDHAAGRLWALSLEGSGHQDPERSWAQTVRHAVDGLQVLEPPGAEPLLTRHGVQLRDSASQYKAKIARAQAEIVEGNSYEVCLTTQLRFELAPGAQPWQLYRRLRRASPAPFAAYLRFGELSVLSTSPERLLRVEAGGELLAEPIKGTRRRDADPARDAALREGLRESAKDRAENIMIVDLMRNDLSRFAQPGSLRVSRLCAIESYTTVHQMVSSIEAVLEPGTSRAEVVAAAFPAGSMTGAPKISTMRILEGLEGEPRGVYSGAIGYFWRDGSADLSVAIRTLVLHGEQASLGLGGAITADSAPEEEWQEVRAKAAGVLGGLGLDFPENR
ncbi:aminodeoxychorismate synthase component I [Acaricomes phytoseiuli]|uniref:aminodeoxychorismate synthase component I n=1 Tax=Acaricomes phytoseiuli TaxID=291968 RepID=UPI000377BE6E|nr:aminodeoxychorismate synthase component I [Acaricomes phytoseiuli]MCW1248894.1 aminodeoxychorismate synthase component I [Acaricomes phytoseiuli]